MRIEQSYWRHIIDPKPSYGNSEVKKKRFHKSLRQLMLCKISVDFPISATQK